jgi:hypothetical protein
MIHGLYVTKSIWHPICQTFGEDQVLHIYNDKTAKTTLRFNLGLLLEKKAFFTNNKSFMKNRMGTIFYSYLYYCHDFRWNDILFCNTNRRPWKPNSFMCHFSYTKYATTQQEMTNVWGSIIWVKKELPVPFFPNKLPFLFKAFFSI